MPIFNLPPSPSDFPLPGKRTIVVGATGSGKTTLAAQLAELTGVPHIEMDSFFWQPGWQKADQEVFQQRTEQAIAAECWVADGNYSRVRQMVWQRATTLVWLDYPIPFTVWRLIQRTVRRVFTREMLWGTNHESLRGAFFSKDSLLIHVFSSKRKQTEIYPQLLASPEFAHLQVLHFYCARQTETWLRTIAQKRLLLRHPPYSQG